jgi:hypothetical protein
MQLLRWQVKMFSYRRRQQQTASLNLTDKYYQRKNIYIFFFFFFFFVFEGLLKLVMYIYCRAYIFVIEN